MSHKLAWSPVDERIKLTPSTPSGLKLEAAAAQAKCDEGDAHLAAGRGVEAFACFHAAALQGLAASQAAVGIEYLCGTGGVERDDNEASRWLRLAADQGHAEGQFQLSQLAFFGAGGVRQSTSKAVALLTQAADQGHEAAASELDRLAQVASGTDLSEAAAPLLPSTRATSANAVGQLLHAPPIATELAPGCRVQLFGLVVKPELNNRTGVVLAFNNSNGRYAVALDGGEGRERINAKPYNVKELPSDNTYGTV
jgi:hypothetical protein